MRTDSDSSAKKPRASRAKKKPADPKPAEAVGASAEMAPREEHDALSPGDVVMLPDGAVAAIEKIVGTDAYVVEWTKQIGRGPWIFPVSELVLVAP